MFAIFTLSANSAPDFQPEVKIKEQAVCLHLGMHKSRATIHQVKGTSADKSCWDGILRAGEPYPEVPGSLKIQGEEPGLHAPHYILHEGANCK